MAIFAASSVEFPNPVTIAVTPESVPPAPAGSSLAIRIVPPNRNVATDRGGFLHRGMQSINKTPLDAECFMQHGDLFWFEHIHLIPIKLELGTVLSTQERTYELYNAYRFTSFTLTEVVKENVDGITFEGELDTSPRILGNKKGFEVTVTIAPNGPVSINASISYTLDTIPEVTKPLTITGTRVVIMSLPPEANVTEQWEYKTDIFTASSGDEFRQSVRDIPRQSFVYRFVGEDRRLQGLLNKLWGWNENVWGLPVWTDYTTLTGDVPAGSTSIPVAATEKRDFRTGTELALIWQDENTFEAFEVTSFDASTLTASQGLLSSFEEGALVMPMRLAKLRNDWQARNYKVAAREISVFMQILNNADFDDVLSPIPTFEGGTYRGLPVWDIDSDYLIVEGSYAEVENKDLRVFGDALGKFSTMTNRDFPQNTVSGFSMQGFGRNEFWRLRAFLHYLRGRQKAVWVSTGREDFTVESTTTAPSTEINVEICDYTNLIYNAVDGPKTRRNIEILYADGSKDRRRIVGSQITEGVREVLTLDAGISQDCSAANVQRISYLVKRRLTSDRVTFEHEFYEGEVIVPGLGLVDVYDGE